MQWFCAFGLASRASRLDSQVPTVSIHWSVCESIVPFQLFVGLSSDSQGCSWRADQSIGAQSWQRVRGIRWICLTSIGVVVSPSVDSSCRLQQSTSAVYLAAAQGWFARSHWRALLAFHCRFPPDHLGFLHPIQASWKSGFLVARHADRRNLRFSRVIRFVQQANGVSTWGSHCSRP